MLKNSKMIFILFLILLLELINPTNYSHADDIKNGEIAKITNIETTSIITGTPTFDSNESYDSQNADGSVKWKAGNDSSNSDRVVRTYDKVTYNLLVTFGMKDEYSEIKSLKGGRLYFECIIPNNQLNNAYWTESNLSNITITSWSKVLDGKKYRYLKGYYDLPKEVTTIPGQVSMSFSLITTGVENGSEIKPVFKMWIDGNIEEDSSSYSPDTVYISAKPNYNILLGVASSKWSNQDLNGDGIKETLGKTYTIPLWLYFSKCTESSKNIHVKGVQNPTSDFNFNIEMILKKKSAQTGVEEITNIKPVFLGYTDSTKEFIENNIANYKLMGFEGGKLKFEKINNSINATISGVKMPKQSIAFGSVLNDFNNDQREDDRLPLCAGSIDVFIPDDDSIQENATYNYYLNVKDKNATVNSYGNTNVHQPYIKDDEVNVQHVTVKGNEIQQLFSPTINFPAISQNYQLGRRFFIYMGLDFRKDNSNNICSVNQFFKFDSDCVKIDTNFSEKFTSTYKNMKFNLYYVTKKDGTNWINQTEMNNSLIDDMNIYLNYSDIPNGKKCVGVYLESTEGEVDVGSEVQPRIGVPVYIPFETDYSKSYTITGYTKVWFNQLDRNKYSITKTNERNFPNVNWDSGQRYFTGDKENCNLKFNENSFSSRNGGYFYGAVIKIDKQSPYAVVMDINNSFEPIIDYNNNEYLADVNVALLQAELHEENFASKYKIKYTMTLDKGVEYVSGSTLKRTEGKVKEPIITKTSDGKTNLEWEELTVPYNEILGEKKVKNITENYIEYEYYKLNTTTKLRFNVEYDPANKNNEKLGGIVRQRITELNSKNKEYNAEFITKAEIINNLQYSLYKKTDTPVIEENGNIHYQIIFTNNTSNNLPDFQLLDILPKDNDVRGSKFNGDYTLDRINITRSK